MIQRNMAIASEASVAGRIGNQTLSGADARLEVLGSMGETTT